MLVCMMYCSSSLAEVIANAFLVEVIAIAMNKSANNIKFLQFKDVQLTCREMLQ